MWFDDPSQVREPSELHFGIEIGTESIISLRWSMGKLHTKSLTVTAGSYQRFFYTLARLRQTDQAMYTGRYLRKKPGVGAPRGVIYKQRRDVSFVLPNWRCFKRVREKLLPCVILPYNFALYWIFWVVLHMHAVIFFGRK